MGKAHLVSHGALGRGRDFLGDHEQDAAVAKLADSHVPGSAVCVTEGARGSCAFGEPKGKDVPEVAPCLHKHVSISTSNQCLLLPITK